MSEFFQTELAKDLDMGPVEPGRRLFRVDLGGGRALIIGAEVEVDPGGMADIRRQVATDLEVCQGIERAAAMMRPRIQRGAVA